jgi:hypothetical protein
MSRELELEMPRSKDDFQRMRAHNAREIGYLGKRAKEANSCGDSDERDRLYRMANEAQAEFDAWEDGIDYESLKGCKKTCGATCWECRKNYL